MPIYRPLVHNLKFSSKYGTRKKSIINFEDAPVRRVWDEKEEKWFFSVVDVVGILSQSTDGGKYWDKLKERLKKEGSEVVTNCHQLKMPAEDGKMRETDVADIEALLRLIQSIPSPKAEPFKMWLAKVGLKTQNLRDNMSEAELIFTSLAEFSTRQIAQTDQAKGYAQNIIPAKKGGLIAKNARKALEAQTGKKVVSGQNFLEPNTAKKLGSKNYERAK